VLGQAVMLTLETEKPEGEVLPEVMDVLMKVLHPHEWPRRVIALRKIERTSSGKVIRGEVEMNSIFICICAPVEHFPFRPIWIWFSFTQDAPYDPRSTRSLLASVCLGDGSAYCICNLLYKVVNIS
jgi:hypothetical protein